MSDPPAEESGPEEVGHVHANVAGGRVRAATFGAMDGLVTNISLVAGVGGAGADAHTIVLSGVAGLVAGAFSMALGEFTSVSTQNEQVDAEVRVERDEFTRHPKAELDELIDEFVGMGMTEETATAAATEIHQDTERAVDFHITQELGVDPVEQPSPWVAAVSSFLMFSIGAVIPLIPYLLGFSSLTAGLLVGAAGLLVAGGLAAYVTRHPMLRGALRQLAFGAIAAGATYLVGWLIGVPGAG
ncbi:MULTISPECIES: VIT1/CCC1 transporter family protein [unclassified Gordonia (in: high G+C Gram-positive bacteria)]|uniref:VIT1/CCC1 transporter family protein n=1 Tax=unclassified Gordonia (in: high G+C Gram-positive bacteria) TaxID=2657482 RepID=UPI001F110C49|nr:VIT1/CCC1 transporter family protein [Gordonia sp. ABSL49_1]MCH5644851.1 VIT1/CCC1 transporter family protein [Gordonia sp. ABSL49_1]